MTLILLISFLLSSFEKKKTILKAGTVLQVAAPPCECLLVQKEWDRILAV